MMLSATLTFPPIHQAVVPVQALEYSGTKRYVYRIDENSIAHRTEVHLGAGSTIWCLSQMASAWGIALWCRGW